MQCGLYGVDMANGKVFVWFVMTMVAERLESYGKE